MKVLEEIEKEMKDRYDIVKKSRNNSVKERDFGSRSRDKSRSRSRDREEEEYPKEEKKLVAKVAHSLARVRHQQYMREKTGNTNLTVLKGQFDKLPNQGPYYNPNLKKGGRTRKNKK